MKPAAILRKRKYVPPTVAADLSTLMRFNGSLADVVTANTWTAQNGAAITTTSPINGSGSLDVWSNTAGDSTDKSVITTTNPAKFNFGTGPFTVTWRCRSQDNGQFWTHLFQTGHWVAGFRWNCKEIQFDGENFDTGNLALNGSNHEFEFCKAGSGAGALLYAFADGALLGSTDASWMNYTTATGLMLGQTAACILDEVRIIKGRALHTAAYTVNLAAELSSAA